MSRLPGGAFSLTAENFGGKWGSRRQRLVSYVKAKKDSFQTEWLEDDSPPAGAVAIKRPFKDEQLVVYPSYTRQLAENDYEVEVRGYLFMPGLPGRKTRMIQSIARQIAGIDSSSARQPDSPADVDRKELELAKLIDIDDDGVPDYPESSSSAPPAPPSRSSTAASSNSLMADAAAKTLDETLKLRLSPFMARPAASRELTVSIGPAKFAGHDQLPTERVVTNNNGRFSRRFRVGFEPGQVSVRASDELELVAETMNVSTEGVSVITDIDDTIRHTGVRGDKREMFRNVLVKRYDEVVVDGVAAWYRRLADKGVAFHYVSNSPWQLFSTIEAFISASGFPPGSIHLKEYTGFMTGIMEPAAERKRSTLEAILRDFPKRKFVLIGDSGEGDLEAYVDLAASFPDQVAAIYIRDVTLPQDDQTNLDGEPDAPDKTPSLIDLDDVAEIERVVEAETESAAAPQQPARPPKPAHLRPARPPKPASMRGAPLSRSDQVSVPPLPPRPTGSTPRARAAASNISPDTSSSSSSGGTSSRPTGDPILLDSSQDSLALGDVLDQRHEGWKSRIWRARRALPRHVQLRTWRLGNELARDSLHVLDDLLQKYDKREPTPRSIRRTDSLLDD